MKTTKRQRWIGLAAAACVALVAADRWAQDADDAAATKDLSEIVVAPVRAAASAPAAPSAEDRLDTALIAARTAAPPSRDDAFAARNWVRPPPPAPPVEAAPPPPPPPPQAPPLPYKLLGRLDETPQKTVWYLGDGERLLLASPGETIDGAWRLDGVEGGALRFTYLPLALPQRLPIGGPP